MAKKLLVYGLGVIGSVYAVRLAKAGFAVSVLARGDRLAALRAGALGSATCSWTWRNPPL